METCHEIFIVWTANDDASGPEGRGQKKLGTQSNGARDQTSGDIRVVSGIPGRGSARFKLNDGALVLL